MLRSRVLTVLLVLSWLFCGIITSFAGFLGFFVSPLWIVLFVPLSLLSLLALAALKFVKSLSRFETILLSLLAVIWSLNFLQVFVPETGFDALWYHLPAAKFLVESHRFVYSPEIYQTANPQFADSIFSLGFMVLGSFGTKLVAFGFALTLIAVIFQLARLFISRSWALIFVITISTFQVVAWQSSSFYVDVAKAVVDLSTIWLVLLSLKNKKHESKAKYLWLAVISFSASLASKAFSVLLLPSMIFAIIVASKKLSKQVSLSFVVALSFLALPFYLFSLEQTGSLFYSIQKHTSELSSFTNSASVIQLISFKFIELPKMIPSLFFTRDYTSPLMVLLPIAIYYLFNEIKKNTSLQILTFFTLNQLGIWWFVPPLSTRYALGGFITGLLLVFLMVAKLCSNRGMSDRKAQFAILIVALLMLLPRIIVANRSIHYIFGAESEQEYIDKLRDTNNSSVFDGWYKNE
ncbi:MAG: hypothetical protein COY80_02710 [Candidatus Pacebacteria bacterium CG_4_10_14_0_8_um_filter_42_14]|nr:MAG: hypothetical protein COY80_02710 [Candidatus Pacebacteria bacterium CG_4_10_14_0_8_um_filter_42_14]